MSKGYLISRVTDEEFARIVAASSNLNQIAKALGMRKGSSYPSIQRRIAKLNLSIAHFYKGQRGGTRITADDVTFKPRHFNNSINVSDLTDEEFTTILAQVSSFQAFARAIGRKRGSGDSTDYIRKRAAQLGLSMDHFRYTTAGKGVSRRPERIFTTNSDWGRMSSSRIVERLFDHNLKPKICEKCGTGETWMGEPLHFKVMLRNNIRSDLRLENIQLFCPNCWYQENRENAVRRGRKATAVREENRKLAKYQELLREG